MRPVASVLAVLGIAGSAVAQESAVSQDTTVSLRADGASGSRQLDRRSGAGQASAWVRTELGTAALGTVVADGWLRAQDHATGRDGRVRELYWSYRTGPAQVKIGRQIMAWGRADGINPTDNLTPRDFTMLTPEDGDQRSGADAVQVILKSESGRLSGVFMPHASSHVIPLESIAGVRYATLAPPRDHQWAIKWDVTRGPVDGSISYFKGADLLPDLALTGVDAHGAVVTLHNSPMRVLGADLNVTGNGMVWRAESAYTKTASTGATDWNHKKGQLSLVAGPELSVGEVTTVGVQLVVQKVRGFLSPDRIAEPLVREVVWRQASTSNQVADLQRGMTLRLASRWWNDQLAAETSAVLMSDSGGGLWRTKFNYEISDRWRVLAGSDYFFGPHHSLYGALAKNSLIFAQLRFTL